MLLQKLKKFADFPVDKKYRGEIEAGLSVEAYRTETLLCIAILIMQSIMIVLFLNKPGGPFTTLRRTGYFFLYCFLFWCALIYLAFVWRGKSRGAAFHLRMEFLFAAVICLWSISVTLLDQIGGNGLIVYSYMLPATAALVCLRPWECGLLFGLSCVVLNSFLPFFPEGIHNLFSNLVNSIFISLLSIFISYRLYHGRVIAQYDRIVIRQQYEEIRRANQQLNRLVMTDQLTQLNNRRYLEESVQKMFDAQSALGRPVAGLMLDIDFFKEYNDHYGHQAGDQCLQEIARVLLQFIKDRDAYAVRYGGEEFFICLFGYCRAEAAQAANTLHGAVLSHGFTRADQPIGRVTVSIGVCVREPEEQFGLFECVRRADKALYHAKKNGRNQVALYQES